MSLRYYYRDNNGDIQELSGQVRRMELSASANAEEGSVGSFELEVDDPEGTFDIRGHRRFYIVEDAALGDPYAGVVWSGYTGDRDVFRGPARAGPNARTWTLHLHDINTLFDRRINVGNDCDRPAETDLARINWLMSTAELGSLIADSTTYIDSTDAVDMDATDYRGQKVLDVIDDCAQQSGRNYFLFWLGGPDDFYLWYKYSASSNYTSNLRISNTLADVNSSTIFAPDHETRLTRDPSRVYSGVYQTYDGGAVYQTRPETGERFAKRDVVGRAENVKTESTATRRALRYLNDIDTELDTIATSVVVDGGKINGLMQGHRVLVKYSHLPGYSDDYKPMRVRDRTVHEIAPDTYEIAMNLTGPSLETLETPGGGSGLILNPNIFARMTHVSGPYPLPSGDLLWQHNSDSGLPWEHTNGPFTFVTSGRSAPAWRAIQIDDDGVLQSVVLDATAIGVGVGTDDPYTVTFELMLNDTSIESKVYVVTIDGASNLWATRAVFEVTDLAVSNGDILWGRLSCLPHAMQYFRSPHGIDIGALTIRGGAF